MKEGLNIPWPTFQWMVTRQALERAFLDVTVQEACIFAVVKPTGEVVRLPADNDIMDFVKEYVITGFLRTRRRVEALSLLRDSRLSKLEIELRGTPDFCAKAAELVQDYCETLRSRTALIILTKFVSSGKVLLGFFQLSQGAVIALYPSRKELKVVRKAFRKFEKAFTMPSLVTGFDVSSFQRSKSRYFEKFMEVKRPPTAEELLEQLVEDNDIETLSELVAISKRNPGSGQARVRIEMADTKADVRLDEVKSSLASAAKTFVVLRQGAEAWVRVGKKRLAVDSEGLPQIADLIRERALV